MSGTYLQWIHSAGQSGWCFLVNPPVSLMPLTAVCPFISPGFYCLPFVLAVLLPAVDPPVHPRSYSFPFAATLVAYSPPVHADSIVLPAH